MTNIYDIIVIGAGPAGAMAAASAVSANRRVCLIERKPAAGIPVRCGEGIGYKGMTLTLEPKTEWIKSVLTRAVMISPSGIKVEIGDMDKSWIIDREIFDNDLVKSAIEKGVDYFSSTAITSVRKSDDGSYICKGVIIPPDKTSAENCAVDKTEFTAPIVILADGVESRLARDLGWRTALRPRDVETCAFARVSSPSIDQQTCVFHIGSRAAPGGYLWIFPRGNNEANVGLGINGSKSSPGLPKKLLLDFINKEFPNAKVTHLHCGAVPAAKWTRPLVRGGAMLVGDAARQVNAMTGAGIAYSLYAGKLAGETAAKSFRNDGTINHTTLPEYQKQWSKNFGKQQDRSFALKEFILSSDDNFLDKIASSLSKEDPARINYLRVFAKTFASKPLLLLKAMKLFR